MHTDGWEVPNDFISEKYILEQSVLEMLIKEPIHFSIAGCNWDKFCRTHGLGKILLHAITNLLLHGISKPLTQRRRVSYNRKKYQKETPGRKEDPFFPFRNNVVVREGIGYLKGTSKASSSCCANPCSSRPVIADAPPLCSWPWWGSACLLDPCHPTYQRAQEAGDAGWWGSHPHAAHCHPWEDTDRCPGLGQTPSKEERKIISLSHPPTACEEQADTGNLAHSSSTTMCQERDECM